VTREREPEREQGQEPRPAVVEPVAPALVLASQIGNQSFGRLAARRTVGRFEAEEHQTRRDDQVASGQIRGSVGRGGKNFAPDVEFVRNRLTALGYPSTDEGTLGDAIAAYQMETLHFKLADGRVDPNGKTLGALNAGKTARGGGQKPDPGPAPQPDPGPKPGPAPGPSGDGWVEGQWSDADFKGEQTASISQVGKKQLYDEIAKVAPHLSYELLTCMVGHAWAEQQGKNLLNYNFAGVEGGSAAWVLGWTSTIIPTATYENEPDKTKYKDWDSRNHNPKFGRIDGHDAGTIDCQLTMDPKPARIALLVKKRRPAYQSLAHASAAFVHLIELRVEALRASTNPDHNALGEAAFAGDADAYAKVVNGTFKIKDKDGKKRDFYAYNGDKGYPGLVKAQIAAARADIKP
jgi:hypothetical protein